MTREQQLAEWKRQRDAAAAAQRKQEKPQRPKTPTAPKTPPVQRARAVSTTTTTPRSSRQPIAEQRRKTMTAFSAKKGTRDAASSERRIDARRQLTTSAAAATAAQTLTAEPPAPSQQQIQVQQHEDHDACDTMCDSQDPQNQEAQGRDSFDPDSNLRERYYGVEYDPERYKAGGEEVVMMSQHQRGIDAAGQHKSFDEDVGLDKENGPHVSDEYPLSNSTSGSQRSSSSSSSSCKASRSGSSSSSSSNSTSSRSKDDVEMPMAEDVNTRAANHDEGHDEDVVGTHLDLSDVFDSDHDEELAMLDELVPMMESYVHADDAFCTQKDEDIANELEALGDGANADGAANTQVDASILFEGEATHITNEGEDASEVTESEHAVHAAANDESVPGASELMEDEHAEDADVNEDSATAAEPTSLSAQEEALSENIEPMAHKTDQDHVSAPATEESETVAPVGVWVC
uniref:Uncharacterized protein n=1 Tax=Globisporangium ultimum (strain ATCC 200006 / CBS 805.95 / DAOM BR144) TaxID=431595 RepID=K3WM30_GLOUD